MATNNKKFLAGIVSFFLLFVLIIPVLANAALIDCNIATTTPTAANPSGFVKPCDFNTFVETINRIINWIISIAGVIFTISAIYGGFLYMTSGTSLGDKEKAKSILWSTLIGFVIILCAWLIVYTILRYLVGESSDVLRFLK